MNKLYSHQSLASRRCCCRGAPSRIVSLRSAVLYLSRNFSPQTQNNHSSLCMASFICTCHAAISTQTGGLLPGLLYRTSDLISLFTVSITSEPHITSLYSTLGSRYEQHQFTATQHKRGIIPFDEFVCMIIWLYIPFYLLYIYVIF